MHPLLWKHGVNHWTVKEVSIFDFNSDLSSCIYTYFVYVCVFSFIQLYHM